MQSIFVPDVIPYLKMDAGMMFTRQSFTFSLSHRLNACWAWTGGRKCEMCSLSLSFSLPTSFPRTPMFALSLSPSPPALSHSLSFSPPLSTLPPLSPLFYFCSLSLFHLNFSQGIKNVISILIKGSCSQYMSSWGSMATFNYKSTFLVFQVLQTQEDIWLVIQHWFFILFENEMSNWLDSLHPQNLLIQY